MPQPQGIMGGLSLESCLLPAGAARCRRVLRLVGTDAGRSLGRLQEDFGASSSTLSPQAQAPSPPALGRAWMDLNFLSAGPLLASWSQLYPSFSLKSWNWERAAMGCTYSSPQDEPTLRRSVPDNVPSGRGPWWPWHPDWSVEELPAGRGHPGGMKTLPCRVAQQRRAFLGLFHESVRPAGGWGFGWAWHWWPLWSQPRRLHFPASEGRDLSWKLARPQSQLLRLGRVTFPVQIRV